MLLRNSLKSLPWDCIDPGRRMKKSLRTFISKFDQRALALVGIAILSAILYYWKLVAPLNLLEHANQPRLDGSYLFYAGSRVRWEMMALFLVQGLLYWAALRTARRAHGRQAWAALLGGMLLLSGVMLFLSPFDAADIYDNILHGRILGVYGANPYLKFISQIPTDPFYRYTAWKNAASAYGPAWELLAGLAATLSGKGIIANVLAFKLLPGLFLFGSAALVALISSRKAPGSALANTLFLAWNPLALYETWGNGHNDMAMVFWILLAVLALQRGRYSLSVISLVIGALFKFIPALLIPAIGLLSMRQLPSGRRRWNFLLITAFSALVLVTAAYAPFWRGVQVLSLERRMNLFSASLPASIYNILMQALGKNYAASLVSYSALGLTLAFTMFESLRARRSNLGDRFTISAFNILAFYLLVACLWFQQWYLLWLLSLAAVLPASPQRALAAISGFWILTKQFVIGPALLWPRPHFPQPWLEIWFTSGIMAVPWACALYALWASRGGTGVPEREHPVWHKFIIYRKLLAGRWKTP
jgi:hypothetical protein